MAEYDSLKGKQEQKSGKEKLKETYYRLTAPVHVTLNSFKEHKRIEGYYEFKDYGHIFQCDRLLKLETVYGKVQMGYNPNRKRSFVFANMKTNLYDTVNTRYQKTMKEYQRQTEQKKGNENKAYVSGRWKNAAVLLEKAENKPWSAKSMEPYFNNTNMEALLKTMPYLDGRQEQSQLQGKREEMKSLQEAVRQNALEGKREENAQIHRQMREVSEESSLLQAILYRKDAGKRGFVRKINYAFDIEKNEMFEYYRAQRIKAAREQIEAIDANAESGEGNSADQKEKEDN